jgi:hypothetical protein
MAIDKLYSNPQRYVWVNTGWDETVTTNIPNQHDIDLFPIRIDVLYVVNKLREKYGYPILKKFPEPDEVINYGLHPSEQYWQKREIPEYLSKLNEESIEFSRKTANKKLSKEQLFRMRENFFWDKIKLDQPNIKDEIKWLKDDIRFRVLGLFYYIKGELVWIPPDYYFILQYGVGTHTDKILSYRKRELKMHTFFTYCENTTLTFKNRDKDGKVVWDVEHEDYPEEIDTGHRTCIGAATVKGRRCGATTHLVGKGANKSTLAGNGFRMGIQGCDEDHCKNPYKENMTPTLNDLPIWAAPYLSLEDKKMEIHDTRSNLVIADSKNPKFFDGKILDLYINDESAKFNGVDINQLHETLRKTLSLGDFYGVMYFNSTTDEQSKEGAKDYEKLLRSSMFEYRNSEGHTGSGLFTYFISAVEGKTGYIDKYGEDIIKKPTDEQSEFIGRDYGAFENVDVYHQAPLKNKDYVGYYQRKRLEPLYFKDCFIKDSTSSLFQTQALMERMFIIKNDKTKTISGFFRREGGMRSKIKFVHSENEAKFHVSKGLSSEFFARSANRKIMRPDGQFAPLGKPRFVGSSDPFRVKTTISKTPSDAAFVIKELFDSSIDSEHDNPLDWETDNIVCDYLWRPEKGMEEAFNDIILATEYYGAYHYGERNVVGLEDAFEKANMRGYLLHRVNKATGKLDPMSGFYTGDKSNMHALLRAWLDNAIPRLNHIRIIEQLIDIKDMSEMTHYDLVTCMCGIALAEDESTLRTIIERSYRSSTADIMKVLTGNSRYNGM